MLIHGNHNIIYLADVFHKLPLKKVKSSDLGIRIPTIIPVTTYLLEVPILANLLPLTEFATNFDKTDGRRLNQLV